MKRIFLSILLLTSFFYISNAQSVREPINKETYSGEWIFTVDELVLVCRNGGQVAVYNYDDGKEYSLTDIDIQTQKVLFVEPSADPILIKNADTTKIISEGKALCKGDEKSSLPDISDERMTMLARNRIISILAEPLSFEPISSQINKDDDYIYVTINYMANENGRLVNGTGIVVFDYWGRFVGFQ